ncbi:MAG: GTPase domain-containing protein [Acidobacteriota bacterium]
MPFINYANQEVNCKLVYCGPGLSGKTTNILQIYRSIKPEFRGRLVSLFTEAERTVFFDFLPVDLGLVHGFRVRFHLYSVPGQIFHAATRKIVFRGVDAVIFVADSLRSRMDANREALRDLREHLDYYGVDLGKIPYVLQLNKRDLDDVHDVEFLTRELRLGGEPVYQAIAVNGEGVRETIKNVARQLLLRLEQELVSAVSNA